MTKYPSTITTSETIIFYLRLYHWVLFIVFCLLNVLSHFARSGWISVYVFAVVVKHRQVGGRRELGMDICLVFFVLRSPYLPGFE